MMAFGVPRGRLRALLFSAIALVTVLTTVVGVAWAGTSTTLPLAAEPLTSTITISANEAWGFRTTEPTLTSPSAIVMNLDTGVVLYHKNERAQLAMASTTKIMTAVIVLESMGLNTQITMSPEALQAPELEVWAKAGDVSTVEQLLYSLMVPSHNQAALALAGAYPGGMTAFVARMNTKARELGMTGTLYANPSGLDAPGRHYSTAADLATLARYAMTNEKVGPTFRKLVQTREYSLKASDQTGVVVFRTSNELLSMYDWIIGVKTGDTPNAKSCLVAAGIKDGITLLSVVLGQPVHETCFTESQDLLEYGFSQRHFVTILDKGAAIAEAAVPNEALPLQLVAKDRVGKELSKGQSLTATVIIDRALAMPVEAGQAVGRVELTLDGQAAGSVELVTSRAVHKPTLGTKIARFFAGLF
jgi:D-alanyl-D-alanine carboxypeptidase (penicillin-binding protein 5/6)